MTKPAVAFVILTWNSRRYVADCLDSVLACHSIRPLVFVVDNGSTDGTPEILRRFEEGHEDLHCLFMPRNLGTTVSRNLALRLLPGECEYVCVLDSDTVVNDGALKAMVELIEGTPRVGVVGPTMRNSRGEQQLSGRKLPSLGIKLRKALPLESLRKRGAEMEVPDSPVVGGVQDVPYLLSACWLMPASTLREVGYLDEGIFYAPEDADYCLRVRKAGLRVVRCWNAHIVHEYQRLSHRKALSRTNLEHVRGLAHFFRKHGYLFDPDAALEKERS